MKQINLLFVTVFLGLNTYSQNKNDLQKDALKGQVKSTTETVYNIVDGQKGGIYSKNITIYNAGGNRLEKVRYGSDGSLKSKYTYRYDDIGNQIEELYTLADGKQSSKINYTFNDKGQVIKSEHYGPNNEYFVYGVLDRTDITYNEQGKPIKIYNHSGDANWNRHVLKSSNLTYDAKGNMIAKIDTIDDGKQIEKFTYTYDDNGNMISSAEFMEDGTPNGQETFKYDAQGNMIERNSFNGDGSQYAHIVTTYQYDKTGNWLIKSSVKNDKLSLYSDMVIEYF